MVKGETYYAKFQTSPAISLVGYVGAYKLVSVLGVTVLSGTLVQNPTNMELSFSTSTLDVGIYRLIVLVTYPDGFIDAINDEEINIT